MTSVVPSERLNIELEQALRPSPGLVRVIIQQALEGEIDGSSSAPATSAKPITPAIATATRGGL